MQEIYSKQLNLICSKTPGMLGTRGLVPISSLKRLANKAAWGWF